MKKKYFILTILFFLSTYSFAQIIDQDSIGDLTIIKHFKSFMKSYRINEGSKISNFFLYPIRDEDLSSYIKLKEPKIKFKELNAEEQRNKMNKYYKSLLTENFIHIKNEHIDSLAKNRSVEIEINEVEKIEIKIFSTLLDLGEDKNYITWPRWPKENDLLIIAFYYMYGEGNGAHIWYFKMVGGQLKFETMTII